MPDVAIRVDHVGKRYEIGARQKYMTLRESVMSGLSAPGRAVRAAVSRSGRHAHDDAETSIWALDDVSFEVKQGEVVGFIGRNGAGKSTLLKVLSRIAEPTRGTVDIWGRVGALLEVGTGFSPELTGRENIFLNGAILGMPRSDIVRKFDDIVQFAEVERFIDTPVKRYSSGMYLRLAFAVAAHLEPEVLLVDEVLAVGDAEFQRRCLGKMNQVAKDGRTVLFVSHSMPAVARLCQRAIWLEKGRVMTSGETQAVIGQYLSSGASDEGELTWPNGIANPGVRDFAIHRLTIKQQGVGTTSTIRIDRPVSIEIAYQIRETLPYCRIGYELTTSDGIVVWESYDSDQHAADQRLPGTYVASCTVPANLLNTGRYFISLVAGIPNQRNLVYLDGLLAIEAEAGNGVASAMPLPRAGVLRPALDWVTSPLSPSPVPAGLTSL